MGYIKFIPKLFLITFCSFHIYGQDIEWADKVIDARHMDKEYQNNNLGMVLGPPVMYSDEDYKNESFDLFAEGYIVHQGKNKKETADFGFNKIMIANQLCIAGILDRGVIKKAFIILKNEKTVQVYSHEQDKNRETKKFHSISIRFSSETVYGVRLVIDHSKVNKWNIIKGIGIYNGTDEIKVKPEVYEDNAALKPREKLTNVNSDDCADFNPKLSADGSVLYFVRECNDKEAEEIYHSENKGAENWNTPLNIGKPLNNDGHNFIVSSCLNPKVMYVGNTYKSNGESAGIGLSKTVLQDDGTWSIPEKVEIPVLPDVEYTNYYVNLDQTAIFIVAEDKNNTDNLDLYVSVYNKYKRAWDVPVSLGEAINTKFAEDYPYISTDGNTLFFCSNGRMGYGGYDIYVTRRINNSWTEWSTPKNLGPVINSSKDDFSFIVSNTGDYGYLSTISTDTKNPQVDIYKTYIPPTLQQQPLTAVKGKVTSERSNAPVSAIVKYKEAGSTNFDAITTTTDKNGNFYYVLPHGKEYDVEIQASNYFKIADKLSLNKAENKGYFSKNYTIKPFLDSGQVSVLSTVLFEFGNAKIISTSYPELDKMAQQLREQNKSVVEIVGHTDDVGDEDFNLRLSRWRAGAVMDYLVSKGIRAWRLKIKGYGETAPIASNETEDGRALNRRVEITVLQDDFTKKYKKARSSVDKKGSFAYKKSEDAEVKNDQD